MNSTQTENQKFNCLECQNENAVSPDTNVGDYVECDFCGIEYEVMQKSEAGECTLKIVEEEK